MAVYDGLPLNTPTMVSATAESEIWATRTANGGTVETRLIGQAATLDANRTSTLAKAQAALVVNAASLAHAAIPAGAALTTTQLTTIIRLLSAQVDALTRQNTGLILFLLNKFDDVSGT